MTEGENETSEGETKEVNATAREGWRFDKSKEGQDEEEEGWRKE